jgi:tRNA A37 threonylcarbamoyladenosine synthetase subunit TsaC/SUA5/YrdC
MHPKKKTVGVRIPDHAIVHALVEAMGEPLMASTLILPGELEPRSMGWDIKEELDHLVDAVVEAGECPAVPTTVVDFSEGEPEVLRVGAGDPSRFE